MANHTYRAGIVGLGFIGAGDQVSGDALGQQVANLDGTHAEALTRHPRLQLAAGSSRDEGRRQRFAQRYEAPTYADWQTMLEAEDLDLVSVATYAPVHAEITAACARQGVRAVYCEKPIATRLADAEGMVAACAQAGALLAINHNRRFNPNYRRLRDHIAAGGLGRPSSVSLQWGSGRLGNVGTHMIDAVAMITGMEVRAVCGALDLSGRPDCRGEQFRDPGGWGLLRFGADLMATLDAGDYANVPPRIIVNGGEGRALTGRHAVTLEYWNGDTEEWPEPPSATTSMDRAVAEIVAWLDDGGEFPYPAAAAARTFETIVALHASHARQSAWVELPLTGCDREHEVNSG